MTCDELDNIKMLCQDIIDEADGDASFDEIRNLISSIEMILDNSEDLEKESE